MKKELTRFIATGIGIACLGSTISNEILANEQTAIIESQGLAMIEEVEQEEVVIRENVEGIEEIIYEEIILEDLSIEKKSESALEDFIKRMYATCLGRTADQGGLEYWVNALETKEKNGADVGAFFVQSEELQNKNLSNDEYLDVLYTAFFNRAADEGGKQYWLEELELGRSKNKVLSNFVNSNEYQEVCDAYGIERGNMIVEDSQEQQTEIGKFVLRFYQKCMNRTPSQDEINYWENQLVSEVYTGKTFARYFVFSNEFQSRDLADLEYIEEMYKIFFGREGDASGKSYWLSVLKNQGKENVFAGFVQSDEFKLSCEEAGILYEEDVVAKYEARLLELLNEYRKAQGLTTVKINDSIKDIADQYVKDLRSDEALDALQEIDIYTDSLSETFEIGIQTPEQIMEYWKNKYPDPLKIDGFDQVGIAYHPEGNKWSIILIEKYDSLSKDVEASYEEQLLRLINAHRQNQGLGTVTINIELQELAKKLSEDLGTNGWKWVNGASPIYGTIVEALDSSGIAYKISNSSSMRFIKDPEKALQCLIKYSSCVSKSQFNQIGIGYEAKTGSWIVIAIEQPVDSDYELNQFEQELVDYINKKRAEIGSPKLVVDPSACKMAELWVGQLAEGKVERVYDKEQDRYVEVSQDYGTYHDLMDIYAPESKNAYSTTRKAETVEELMSEWNYQYILRSEFKYIGVGFDSRSNECSIHIYH